LAELALVPRLRHVRMVISVQRAARPKTRGMIERIQQIPDGLVDYREAVAFLDEEAAPPTPAIRQALFALLERNPLADFGSPGPVADYLEKASPAYIPELSQSVLRNPSITTLWMINIVLDQPPAGKYKPMLMMTLAAVVERTDIDRSLVEDAAEFIERQD
jgi:hypothetical protein